MSDFDVAIVTGGNRGIGLEIVRQLISHGIVTIFTSRNPHDSLTVLEELSHQRTLLDYHPLDVIDPVSVEKFRKFVADKYGRLTILINNAGANYDTWHRVSEAAISEAQETMNINFFGPWRICKAFLPLLEKDVGRIINVSSGAGTIAHMDGTTPAYSLSKNGLNMLTKSLAADLRPTGITVNAVCPGWTRTDMGGPNAPRSVKEGADTIVWLALDNSGKTSGKLYHDRKIIPW